MKKRFTTRVYTDLETNDNASRFNSMVDSSVAVSYLVFDNLWPKIQDFKKDVLYITIDIIVDDDESGNNKVPITDETINWFELESID
jgi:hypothetical protein